MYVIKILLIDDVQLSIRMILTDYPSLINILCISGWFLCQG